MRGHDRTHEPHPWLTPTISVTCRDCGDQRVGVADVGVRVCVDDGHASHHFACPACGVRDARPTPGRLVAVLRGAGCEVVEWSRPVPATGPTGDPLTLADLEALVEALADDDHLERLIGGLR